MAAGKPTNPLARPVQEALGKGEACHTYKYKAIHPGEDEDLRLVRPDGLSARRRRHDHG